MATRFPIRRNLWLRPLFSALGGFGSNSYIELDERYLRIRFGPLFDSSFSWDEIETVQPAGWHWFLGLGWRTDFRGRIGLVGSYQGMIEIGLRQRRRIRFILPFLRLGCDRIVVSLEQPEAFMAATKTALDQRESRGSEGDFGNS